MAVSMLLHGVPGLTEGVTLKYALENVDLNIVRRAYSLRKLTSNYTGSVISY